MSEHDTSAKRQPTFETATSPLAATRAPAEDIRDWIYWLCVSEMDMPEGAVLHGGMLTDHAALRIITGGIWTAETADGFRVYDPGDQGMALYFGPQTRHMPLTVTGSFKVLTMHLRAGATTVMGGPDNESSLNRILNHADVVGHGNLGARFDPESPDHGWLDVMETELRKFIDLAAPRKPDAVTTAFERASLTQPEMSVSDFAKELGISVRTLERTVRRDYGVSPKKVLRRARALDMAAAILGVVDPSEEDELELRYFDQSHLIKEIRHFFGMTPGELEHRAVPLVRVNMEIRQTRRLEAMGRWTPDEPLPWGD